MRNTKWIIMVSIIAVMILSCTVVFAQMSCQGKKNDCCTKTSCCASQIVKANCSKYVSGCCTGASAVCCRGGSSASCCSGGTMTYGQLCFGDESPWKDLNYNAQHKLMEPMTKKQVEEMAEYFVKWMGNSRLKAGKMVEKKDFFEVPIMTKDNSLVENITIGKETGCISREF